MAEPPIRSERLYLIAWFITDAGGTAGILEQRDYRLIRELKLNTYSRIRTTPISPLTCSWKAAGVHGFVRSSSCDQVEGGAGDVIHADIMESVAVWART